MYQDPDSQFNQIAIKFGNQKKDELKFHLLKMLGPNASGKLLNTIKDKYGYDDAGEIFKIGFVMLRYGILFEKGVGKEVGMKNGVRFPTAKNNTGIIRRKQHPWITEALSDESIMQLAEEISQARGNSELRKYYHSIFDDMTIGGKKI